MLRNEFKLHLLKFDWQVLILQLVKLDPIGADGPY